MFTYPGRTSWQCWAPLRHSPPPFFSTLSTHYAILLYQLHPYSLRRAIALHILGCLYGVVDSLGLIYATHSLKHSTHFYFFSPKPDKNVSFISHKFVDKDFYKYYLCVRPILESEEWPYYSLHQWHPILMEKLGPPRELYDEDILLLSDLSSYCQPRGSFSLRPVTNNSHSLAECGLFPNSPLMQSIFLFFLFLFSSLFMRISLTGLNCYNHDITLLES